VMIGRLGMVFGRLVRVLQIRLRSFLQAGSSILHRLDDLFSRSS
jgi:hypothetical protein